MIRNFILFLIDSVIVLIDGTITGIIMLKDYSVKVWKNNAMRKWVWELMDLIDVIFHRFENYLEELKTTVQYRILYEKITQPMKDHYRELKKKRI